MKQIIYSVAMLCAASATAAQAAEPGDWSGPYVGVGLGYSWLSGNRGESIVFDTDGDGEFDDSVRTGTGANAFSPGFCAGFANTNLPAGGCRDDKDGEAWSVHAGWDMQSGTWLYGLVAEVGRINGNDAVSAYSTTPASYVMDREIDATAQLRVRWGWVSGRTLLYATAGATYATFENRFATSNTTNAFVANGQDDDWGWVAGFGAEYAVAERFTVGLLARYARYGGDGYQVNASRGTAPATNPFVIAPAGSVDFRRSQDGLEHRSVVATISYRLAMPRSNQRPLPGAAAPRAFVKKLPAQFAVDRRRELAQFCVVLRCAHRGRLGERQRLHRDQLALVHLMLRCEPAVRGLHIRRRRYTGDLHAGRQRRFEPLVRSTGRTGKIQFALDLQNPRCERSAWPIVSGQDAGQ